MTLQQPARSSGAVAAVAFVWCLLAAPVGTVWGQVFPAVSGLGAIPDDDTGLGCGGTFGTSPVNVTFNVIGLTLPVADIDIATAFTHTHVGDLDVVLIDPNGTGHILFARTGATSALACGDSSNLAGAYTFRDEAVGTNWWDEASSLPTATPLTPGEYRTTESGGDGQVAPAPFTVLNNAFSGLPALDANGTWTLRIRDWAGGDIGSIDAAALSINQDCNDLTLSNDTVFDPVDFATCDILDVGPNYVVMGPNGDLTLTAGGAVVLNNGFEVRTGGTFTAGTNQGLNPLMTALEVSRTMGEAARRGEPEAVAPRPLPNPDKLRELRKKRR